MSGLQTALLQIKVLDREYRVLYDEEVTRLFAGRQAQMVLMSHLPLGKATNTLTG